MKKLISLLVAVVMMACVLCVSASAAEATQDGVKVTLTTDKETYAADEAITATVSVSNEGENVVYAVNVETVLPEGYKLADDSSNTLKLNKLPVGETRSLTVVLEKEGAAVETTTTVATTTTKKAENPYTGENNSTTIVMLAVLCGAAGVYAVALKNRKGKQMLSMVLVCALTLAAVPALPAVSAKAEDIKPISVTIDVKAGDETVSISAAVSYSFDSPSAKTLDGAKLVVFGDSLTAFGTWPLAAAEETNMYLFNGAMGGINTAEALDRFEKFVANQKPDFVTLCFGQNDLLMEGKNNPQVTPEDFKANLKTMCEQIVELNATPILMTCSYMNVDIWWKSQAQNKAHYTDVGTPYEWLEQYCNAVRELAEEGGYDLVDIRKACDEYDVNEFLTDDGVHLAELGNKVYAEELAKHLKANYRVDPDAEKITNRYPHVDTPAEPAVTDIISYDPAYWDYDETVMALATTGTGALRLQNLNGLWPEAHYAAVESVYAPLEGTELVFDLTTGAGVNTSILLFFNGATPSAPTAGKYIVINPYLGGNTDPGSGDILAGQTLKGSVKLSDIELPADAIDEKGNVLISGVKIFAAGTKNKPVTVRQLAVSTTGAPNA